MAKKGFAHPTALLAVAGVLVALAPLAHASGARAASTQFAFTANAFGSSATVGVAGLGAGSGRSAYVILSCTTKPQTHTDSTAGVNIPGLNTTAGAVTDTVSSAHNTSTGNWSDSASSAIANVSALGGLVKASAVTANASAAEGSGGGTASGTVTLTSLTVGGNSVSAHPAPNTKLSLPGIGSVTLNAQKSIKTSSRALMSVDAIVIVLAPGNTLGDPAGATIVIGHALATVGGPVSGLLSGRSFGTSLTGNPIVTSGPSFAAYVNCTGTGGKTVTNTGASVSVGPLTAGAITDTATGTDTATQLSAKTTSTVANAGVSHVLSVTAISANASASLVGGTIQRAGGITIAGLKVLGLTVTLPATVPPNTSVPLLGGTLILNRQVTGTNGILVEGVYLSLPGVGTVIIASASAYA